MVARCGPAFPGTTRRSPAQADRRFPSTAIIALNGTGWREVSAHAYPKARNDVAHRVFQRASTYDWSPWWSGEPPLRRFGLHWSVVSLPPLLRLYPKD
jgi:hypothetical protein